MTGARPGARPLGVVYTALAATTWSLAGILQRQLHLGLASQLAGRAAFAAVSVLGYVAVAERGHVIRAFRAIGRPGIAVAVLIATASMSFITALNYAPVADVTVIQALVPLAAALMGTLVGEAVRPRTWAAMAVAVGGFAVMAGAPGRPGLAGAGFSFIAMLTFAAMIVITRQRSDVSMAPATCLSQVIVFVVCAPFASISGLHGANLGYVALLGVVQMALGLVFISIGARLIPAAEVALITQLENVLGPLWVWLAGIEHPSAATAVGGVIVISAVVLQITGGSPGRLRRPPEELPATAPPGP